MFKKLNIGFVTLCLYLVKVSVGDPLINQIEREKLTRNHNQKYNVSSAVLKMTSGFSMNDTFGWKCFSYLQKYPGNFDVAFAVGPEKIIVQAPKLILTSSSPVFEQIFENHSEHAMLDDGEAIPLPDLDPEAFKLFVELLILDTWSVDALKALDLPTNQLLHLMSICHKYGLTAALKNLTELASDFLRDFGNLVKPEDFYQLSQPQLEAILASDDLIMKESDVHKYACGWAKEQCNAQNVNATGENMRKVLGRTLYEIRYPSMSITDFAEVTRLKGFLTLEETVEIVQRIAMDKTDRSDFNASNFLFNAKPRSSFSILDLKMDSPINESPPFVCDGSEKYNYIATQRKILVNGLGFLGPIAGDANYDVKIRFVNHGGSKSFTPQKIEKRIFSQKGKIFRILFDQPITLNEGSVESWTNHYSINYSLKGPNTKSFQRSFNKNVIKREEGNAFRLQWQSNQLAEVLYTNA